MNDRIKKLAIDARLSYVMTPDRPYIEEDLQKFAELVVRECIDTIKTYDLVSGHSAKCEDIYDIHARLLQDLGEELKEHFKIKK